MMTIEELISGYLSNEFDLLGRGGESCVYALDSDKALRVYHPGASQDYIKRRRVLYERIREAGPAFEVPFVYEIGNSDKSMFTVEKRMHGRDFGMVLPTLEGNDREKALRSFLEVALSIGELLVEDEAFGELLIDDAIRSEKWSSYLKERLETNLSVSRSWVEDDFPRFGEIWDFLMGELQRFDGFEEKRLVHGDYYPSNVFINERHEICGVGDFGYTTLVGDARMDWAGAVAFLGTRDYYRPQDADLLVKWLKERYGEEIVRFLHFYELYYSVYFSGCKESDPQSYRWILDNFKRHAEG